MKIEISGSSFLKTMVRLMIGSALAIYFEEKDKDYIIRKLENPDADGGKILAPAESVKTLSSKSLACKSNHTPFNFIPY